MARAGKEKGSAHPNVEAAVRGWQNHEYVDTGAAMDALERGNSHLYEEMYPDVDAKTARTRFRKLINAQPARCGAALGHQATGSPWTTRTGWRRTRARSTASARQARFSSLSTTAARQPSKRPRSARGWRCSLAGSC